MESLVTKTKECRSCRTQIDARAMYCPHCRQKQPDPTKGIALVVLACIGVGFCTLNSGTKPTTSATPIPVQSPSATAAKAEPPPPPPTPDPVQEVTEEYFRHLNHDDVHFECDQAIKRLVKYDIRSPGVLYGTNTGMWAFLRFDRWSKRVANDNTIKIYGDEAEAQNGFGNWVRINYSCTIDLGTKKVLRATLDNGRLQ
jgi:hypothetical protein